MTVDKLPKWLNQSLLTKVLQSSEGDKSVQIKTFTVISESVGEDNFSSQIFRMQIEFSCKYSKDAVKNVVVKILANKSSDNVLADEAVFDTELKMYSSVLPKMEHSLEIGGEKVKIAPRLLYYTNDPERVLIMEDLLEQKYVLPDSQMDFANLKVVISKLAKFHANSIQMDHENQKVREFDSGLFNLKSNDGHQFMRENFRMFLMELKKWPEYERYVPKFEALRQNLLEMGKKIYSPSRNGFNVLNHGDFHYKNMMVKKEGHEITDVVFLDYQLSVWATPAIDLFYLLYMVASHEIRENRRTEVVNFYYKELLEDLTKLGHLKSVPSLVDLNVELLENGFLEVVLAVCFLPFLLINSSNAESIFDTTPESDIRQALYSSPEYKKAIQKLLPEFLTKGLLESKPMESKMPVVLDWD